MGNRTENNEVTEIPLGGLGRSEEGLSLMSAEGFSDIKGSDGLIGESINAAEVCIDATSSGQANTYIAESHPGEPWVQGLMEGSILISLLKSSEMLLLL